MYHLPSESRPLCFNIFLPSLPNKISFLFKGLFKINENIDYIAQNSIVDKEETPTSDKETTSEKTPESPEDRLQKLADMKEKGLIDEDEFKSKKEEILKEM